MNTRIIILASVFLVLATTNNVLATPISASLDIRAQATLDQIGLPESDKAIDHQTDSWGTLLSPLSVSASASAKDSDQSIIVSGRADSTWGNAGNYGFVSFRDYGFTGSAHNYRGDLRSCISGCNTWSYTFRADSDGTFALDYVISIVDAIPNAFGLNGWDIEWNGPGGGLVLKDSFNPTASGQFTRPIVAGQTYIIGLSGGPSASSGSSDILKISKHVQGDFAFEIQEDNQKDTDFLNISTRGFVGEKELDMHAGIVVIGPERVQVLVKALGPSLSPELDGLQDPFLRWFDAETGELLHQNDDWQDDPSAEQIKALGLSPLDPNEPAFLLDVSAGSYTAVVSGNKGSTGIAIPSATRIINSLDSENDKAQPTRFLNISTRGFVGDGALNMHAGIVVTGPGIVPVLVKAAGPSLFPALNGLQDPYLRLFDVTNGKLLHANDNWQEDPSANLVRASGMAPTNSKEPGFVMYLPKGSYTAVVSGVDGATGIAIPTATKVNVGDFPALP